MASSCSSSGSSTGSFPLADEGSVVREVVASLQLPLQRQQELLTRIQNCEEEIEKLKLYSLRRPSGGLLSPSEAQKGSEWKAGCKNGELGAGAERMCDYCFKVARCWPCQECEREWYCSSPCQRLREHVHRPFCRHRRQLR
ncbi:uncharacterized protein Tco025E_03283 [Trypanosoma conorhini]|uniref:MYND-type domain-containing protein n=1 Tax=Trypanosoma conorhini TaxID=83891 RepID=A0A422PWJ1_9TRYP|nr:uncharacterized protein Tco025E_03283 [Trypanosoma conorhini]RNF22121.1 hypothetical protein Tco025E_03283 [Trypanosoma conorhini]